MVGFSVDYGVGMIILFLMCVVIYCEIILDYLCDIIIWFLVDFFVLIDIECVVFYVW